MTKGLELVKLAKENNAARFGDVFVAGVQEMAASAVGTQRATMFQKANMSEGFDKFKSKDEDEDEDEDEDKKSKSEDEDDDEDDDEEGKK